MSLKVFRYVALAEATSFLLLLIAAVVKRTDGNEAGVHILGPVHGLLFVAYVAIAITIRAEQGWDAKVTFWILVAAVVPFGGYAVDWWLLREQRRSSA